MCKMLVNFSWSGYHWLQPEILYYPRKEGGQGVINIFGQIVAFRLQSLQKLLFTEQLTWQPFAFFLLQQAGKLRYDRYLFLMDLEHINFVSLSKFYRSLLDIWKKFDVHQLLEAYNCRMFLQEPLFFNNFSLVFLSHAMIQKCIQGGTNKVCDLRDISGVKWKPVGVVASAVCSRSVRLVDQVVRVVIRKFKQLNIGWEGVGIIGDFRLSFPEIKVLLYPSSSFRWRLNIPPPPLFFHLVTKTGICDLRQRETYPILEEHE